MKRRYLAMILGLTLAIAPMNAFAQETELVGAEAVTEAAEMTAEDSELVEMSEDEAGEIIDIELMDENGEAMQMNQFWGKVVSVDDTGITISVGTLGDNELPEGAGEPDMMKASGEEGTDAESIAEGDAEGTDAKTMAEGNAEGTDAESIAEGDAEGTDAEYMAEGDAEETDAEYMAEGDAEGTDAEAMAETGEMPEQISAYDALELTGEEMTIAVTDDTEVYFVYGDDNIAALKMTARKMSNDGEEFSIEVVTEEAAGEEAVSIEESAEGTDAESVEENAEGTDAESFEENAEITDADAISEDENVVQENMMEAAPEEMAELTVESAVIESVIPDDLVSITLDEDGNAAVILVVLPNDEAEV